MLATNNAGLLLGPCTDSVGEVRVKWRVVAVMKVDMLGSLHYLSAAPATEALVLSPTCCPPRACWRCRCQGGRPWLANIRRISNTTARQLRTGCLYHAPFLPRAVQVRACTWPCAAAGVGASPARPSERPAYHLSPGAVAVETAQRACLLTTCPPTQRLVPQGRHNASPADECTGCRQYSAGSTQNGGPGTRRLNLSAAG